MRRRPFPACGGREHRASHRRNTRILHQGPRMMAKAALAHPCASRHLHVPGQWVKRIKAKVRWTFAPLNGFAREGEPWTGKRSGTAKRRLGAAERRAGVQAIALSLRVARRPSSDVTGPASAGVGQRRIQTVPQLLPGLRVENISRSDSCGPADVRPGAICGLEVAQKILVDCGGLR